MMADILLILAVFGGLGLYLEWIYRDLKQDYSRVNIRHEVNRDRSNDWERHRTKK